jgi:transportin-1
MLKTARASPDIDKYLAYVFTNSQPPPVVNMDASHYAQARAAAAIMLKNDVKTSYKTMPDTTKEYIKATIILGLQDPANQMRGYAGNVITEIVRQGGIMGWPQVLSDLISMVSNASGNVSTQAQEGGMGALLKICEDNRRALDKQYQGQRPLGFLFPKLLELTSSPVARVRADALASLNIFIPEKPQAVIASIDELLQQLFNLASDSSDDVRKHVCRAFVHIADIAPEKIIPHMEGLVEYMVTQQRNPENAELALDAAEFWLCVGEDENMRDHLGPYLPKIIPVLLSSMVYSEDEILRLEGEEDDYDADDRQEDIRPNFASTKTGRLTTAANGEDPTANGNFTPANMDDDDLSDGEIDEFEPSQVLSCCIRCVCFCVPRSSIPSYIAISDRQPFTRRVAKQRGSCSGSRCHRRRMYACRRATSTNADAVLDHAPSRPQACCSPDYMLVFGPLLWLGSSP